MIKSFLLVLIIFFFTACSSSVPFTYTPKINELKFQISKEHSFIKKLNNPQYILTSDTCANESYLLKEERYFIEYISLDTNCSWNGLSSGYFQREFKDKLNIKAMETVEQIDIKNYSFSTFKINDKDILNTITIYTVFSDIFIIDYEGVLYEELLLEFKPTYKNNFKSLPRFKANYTYSMVNFNFINNYFNRESGDFLE